MQDYTITGEQLQAFRQRLVWEEKSPATIEKYLRDAADFTAWLEAGRRPRRRRGPGRPPCWRRSWRRPPSTSSWRRSTGSLYFWAGRRSGEALRIQRRLFREPDRELDRSDYLRLIRTARQQGKKRLALLMETICATGIRVSEVPYITLEAAQAGKAEIALEG